MPAFKLLLLLLLINGAPLVLVSLFPKIAGRPVDYGLRFFDGYPFLGNHKTMGGFLIGILAGSVFGLMLGFPLIIGFLAGLLSMIGDSFTSFIKRRLQVSPGINVLLLDQFFEGLLPILLVQQVYSLALDKALSLLCFFIIIALTGSKLLMKILPSNKTSPDCVVRSRTSFRKWRACHTALSPFARMLNFENVIYYRWFMKGLFKCAGIYNQGKNNALQVRLKSIDLSFPELPERFDKYRILFISDLHLDGLQGLPERLMEAVSQIKADVCLLGGDYRMEMYGSFDEANRKLDALIKKINAPDGVFGVLGNHDCLEIAPEIEDSGVCMLINDSITVERGEDMLSIVGVDDPHYYKCHNLKKAFMDVPAEAFSVLIAHSPEIIQDTASRKIDLCLCGHTHGGQIRLPYIGAVFTHCKAPRRFAAGLWTHGTITGYTSNGAGASGVPVRFNCPPEIVLVTLRKALSREINEG